MICLLSFVLVLGLVLTSGGNAAEARLVGWWKFDDGSGTTAIDSSGNGFDITLHNTTWEDGVFGGAVHFHGVGYGDVGNFRYIDNAITVCAWVWHDEFRVNRVERYVTVGPSVAVIRKTANGRLHFYIKTGGNLRHLRVKGVLTEGQWHHVAGTWDGLTQRLYIDGVEIASQAPGGVLGDTSDVMISSGGKPFNGMLDEVRIYNSALTQDEIQVIMQGEEYPFAFSPTPADGATHVDAWASLSWSPGYKASQHDVYLGTDKEAVRNANTGSPEYKGTKAIGSESYDPGKLEWDTIYHWRVDEVNDLDPNSPWKGNVWSFLVADFITIDDFEDYNDYPPDEIFSTWIDGRGVATNGALVGYSEPDFAQGKHYVETTVVHGGSQSMPYFYDNHKTRFLKYSEAQMTLSYPRDWTEKGVNTLTIWFRGNSDNAAEPMYVALNGSAVVYHNNPGAAQIDDWTEWNINLQAFADQGVDLANVDTIALGFGDKNNPQAGGSGVVYFDDIRLYLPFPEPEPTPSAEPEWINGQYFPHFPSTNRIYVFPVRTELDNHNVAWVSEFRINESYETMMALTLVGMQGVINRNGPQVYLDWEDAGKGHPSRFWVPYLEEHVEVVELDLDHLSVMNFLLRRYGSHFSGAVIYDPEVPDTINLATMLAGLENRVMLAPEQLGLLGRIPAFDSVTDLRLLVQEQGWDTTEESKYRIYQWVYDNLWPRLEKRIIGMISPGPPTSQEIEPDFFNPLGMAARDYLVALRLSALWLDPRDSLEAELFARFLEDAPSPIPVTGAILEVSATAAVSSYGDWMAPITWPNAPLSAGNLTVFSGVRPDIKRYQPQIDINRILATLGERPVTTIWCSDGGNIQYQMNRGFHGLINWVWERVQGHRFGWTTNPTLIDLAPLIWNYYVDSRNEVCLLSGFSGAGYMYPHLMDDTQLRSYLMYTATYLDQTGLRAVWVDGRGGEGPWDEYLAGHYYKGLRDTGYLGAFVGYGGPWDLGFEYAGVPAPGVYPAYSLPMTDSASTDIAWIIEDILARRPGELFCDLGSDFPWHRGEVVQDEDAVGGEAIFVTHEFINSPSCCHPVYTPKANMAPGDYTATFRLKVPENQTSKPVAEIYVGNRFAYPAWRIIARQSIAPVDFQEAGEYQNFSLTYTLDSLTTDIEFRIRYLGGHTDLFADTIMVTREGAPSLPVFAAVFIGLTGPASHQRLTDVPQFAEDFERAGGIVLTPDEFLAALNPEYMIELASPILGSEHPALTEARERLAAGDYLTSLVTVRNALRVASPEPLPPAPPAPPPPADLDYPKDAQPP